MKTTKWNGWVKRKYADLATQELKLAGMKYGRAVELKGDPYSFKWPQPKYFNVWRDPQKYFKEDQQARSRLLHEKRNKLKTKL